jgi:hypothetical protein
MIRRVLITGLGVVGMAVLTIIQMQFFPVNEHIQFGVLCLSMVALVIGLGETGHVSARQWMTFSKMVPIVVLTVAAFEVRIWRIDALMRVLVDEVNSLIPLISLWVYPDIPLLTHMNTNVIPYTWLYPYLQNAIITLVGNDLFGLRLISIIGGALTVPTTYVLALTLTDDRRTALLSGVGVAALPLAIHYSRLGIHSSLDPLVGVLALLFVARGWKHNTRTDWALAGIWLGLTHYFWEGGRLFNSVFVLLLLMWLALTNEAQFRMRWRGMLVGLFTFVVMTLPLYITWSLTGDAVQSRLENSGVNAIVLADVLTSSLDDAALQNYLRGIADAYLILFVIPETSPFFGGGQPFLLVFVSPFALIGLLWTARQWRNIEIMPLLWVLAVPAANGLLLAETTASPRFLNLIPVLGILVGYGVAWVARRFPVRWQPSVAYVVAGVLFAGQVGYYYGVHTPRFNVEIRQGLGDIDDATLRAADLPLDAIAVIVPTVYRDPRHPDILMRYLYHNDPYPTIATMESVDFVREMTAPDALADVPPGGYALFIEHDDIAAQEALQSRFGPVNYTLSPYPVPESTQFRMYRVVP